MEMRAINYKSMFFSRQNATLEVYCSPSLDSLLRLEFLYLSPIKRTIKKPQPPAGLSPGRPSSSHKKFQSLSSQPTTNSKSLKVHICSVTASRQYKRRAACTGGQADNQGLEARPGWVGRSLRVTKGRPPGGRESLPRKEAKAHK